MARGRLPLETYRTLSGDDFTAQPNPDAIVSTTEVEQAITQQVCVVNALARAYAGTGDFYYHRRGHIPSSLLLHFDAMPENEYFKPQTNWQRLYRLGTFWGRPRNHLLRREYHCDHRCFRLSINGSAQCQRL